jgi:outer membrane immunogenic protein
MTACIRTRAWLVGSVAAAVLGAGTPATAQETGPSAKWEGFYAGAALGYRKLDSEWRTTRLLGPPFPPFPITDNRHQSLNDSGLSYGLYGGYNWSLARDWLIGVEGRIGDSNNKRKTRGTPGWISSQSQDDTLSIESKWDGSAALRLGYLAAPDLLLYGSAGMSHQKVVLKYSCSGNFPVSSWCINPHDDKESIKKNHWTIGGGAELMALGNWLFRLDYRYAPYSDKNVKFIESAPIDSVFGTNMKMTTHIFSVGAAYKF